MTPEEKDLIARWAETTHGPIIIGLSNATDAPGRLMADFCHALAELAPAVSIKKRDGGMGELPAIHVGSKIQYHAVPLGAELGPFLDAATCSVAGGPPVAPEAAAALERMRLPALFKLYVTQHCPFCPVTARMMLPLAFAGKMIRLHVIDGMLFPEAASADQIKAVPTLLLDTAFRWTGAVSPAEVARMAADRDPSQLSAESLKGMIKEGKAAEVAGMMRDAGRSFPALLDLLANEKWPERLGAMVVAEHLAESAPELATELCRPLSRRFETTEPRVRGDILHVMGEIGCPEAADLIRSVLADEGADAELREAAAEAAEKLAARGVTPPRRRR